jgi:oligopeptide/dipeptide ABC transporter ATP-binding protein
MTALLEVRDLSRTFRVRSGHRTGGTRQVRAVDRVSFDVGKQETVALVGESGCGKTTTGLAALRLIEPTAGRITFDSTDLMALSRRRLREIRAQTQIVLQDPRGQLDPRMRVADIVAEPLHAHRLGDRTERRERVREVLGLVGMGDRFLDRFPHQLSGGQRQRIGIARALAPSPKLVVCDEAVSALDVSVQTQVLNLLRELQDNFGVSYLFISHGMAAVRYIADRVVVMYLGRSVESAPAEEFFASPAHPYSAALMSAVPSPTIPPKRERIVLAGDVPSPFDPPHGCVFHTRCPHARPRCAEEEPAPVELSSGRQVACHYPLT